MKRWTNVNLVKKFVGGFNSEIVNYENIFMPLVLFESNFLMTSAWLILWTKAILVYKPYMAAYNDKCLLLADTSSAAEIQELQAEIASLQTQLEEKTTLLSQTQPDLDKVTECLNQTKEELSSTSESLTQTKTEAEKVCDMIMQ